MKNTRIKLSIAILFITCIFGLSCGKDKVVDSGKNVSNTDFVAKESFSFTVAVEDHARLRLEGVNGNITVTGKSDSDSVLITGEKRVGSESIEDAQEHLQVLEVKVQDLGDEVFVKTIQPEKTYGRNYSVDYNVTLPRNLQVFADNVNGTVIVNSLDNAAWVDNVNGQVTLNGIFGSAGVTLINGQIEGEITLPSGGAIGMSVVNGNIGLNIPTATSAEFSASVTNGTISFYNLYLQNQVSAPDSLTGRLGDGQGIILLITVNGNISVSGF